MQVVGKFVSFPFAIVSVLSYTVLLLYYILLLYIFYIITTYFYPNIKLECDQIILCYYDMLIL